MAPKKGEAKVLPKKDATKVTKGGKVAKTEKKVGKPRNYDLGNGIYRFSKTRMFHKKAKYKFIGKKNPKVSGKIIYLKGSQFVSYIVNFG